MKIVGAVSYSGIKVIEEVMKSMEKVFILLDLIFWKLPLPFQEKIDFQFSYSDHDQNSVYGDTPYLAKQRIGFGQFIWDKKIKSHDLLMGAAVRFNYYNDNTTATTPCRRNNNPFLVLFKMK